MKIEKAINILENGIWWDYLEDCMPGCMSDELCDAILTVAKALDDAPNDPLTVDELREMDGKPVWCESLLYGTAEWAILRIVEMSNNWFIGLAGATRSFGDKYTYGKAWLAYRRKPEGSGE